MEARKPALLRLVASAVVACAMVVTVLAALLRWFYHPESVQDAMAADVIDDVRTVDLSKDPRLRELIEHQGIDVGKEEHEAPPPAPPRIVHGFVQVAFVVAPDGSVQDAKVIGAVPEGYYEQQALAQIRARRYDPTLADGHPVSSRRSEIVRFDAPVHPTKR